MESWPRLSHSESNRFTNTRSDYFLVPECTVQLDIFGSWKNPHLGSLTCGIRANIIGKAR